MIKIYREHREAIFPTKAHVTDAGFDIYSIERRVLIPGQRALIQTGLRIIVPEDSYYTFAPRSSLAFKRNVIPSHHNVMDSGYRGNCAVLMYNRSSISYEIGKGDRFCQLIVYKVPYKLAEEISEDDLYGTSGDRKDAGFGSSGR
jgi:dUTP pyrophosphatase|tara:strand:+ start:875 stop:1309 length:435 start_codon:yes stop_codon:yes gene_type:complete